jgi:hypothetical protein
VDFSPLWMQHPALGDPRRHIGDRIGSRLI